MKNFISPGATITVPSPSNISSGAGVVVGDLFGVASGDAKTGEPLDLAVTGCFQLPKESDDIIGVGAAVGWDVANSRVSTDGYDLQIGHAIEAAGNGVTSIAVRLAPSVAA